MDFDDPIFGYLGLAAVLLLGAWLAHMVLSIPNDPATVATIAASWPWAAKHLQGLTWTAAVIIIGVAALVPLVLTFRHVDREGDLAGSPMVRLGVGVWVVCATITVGRVAFHYLPFLWK